MLLSARGLVRRHGERTVIGGLDVDVDRGQLLVVSGVNGAGKTTLLRLLCGLLAPDAGTVALEGAPVGSRRARGRIGYVGHQALCYLDLSARQNLRFGARLHGVAAARADALADWAGLGGRADAPLREVSAGQRQRTAVARALLGDPVLLVLDEPFTALDDAGAALLAEAMDGRACVVATHDRARFAGRDRLELAL